MGEEVIVRRGLVKKHASVDYEVWQWKTSLEQTRGTQRVTKTEVQAFAVEAYKRAGITNFKASDGWYRRWRVRWQLPGVVRIKVKEENNEDPKSSSSCKQQFSNKKRKEVEDNYCETNKRFPDLTKKSQQTSIPVRNSKPHSHLLNNKTGFYQIDKLESKWDSSDFPNMLGLVRVNNVNLTRFEQFGSNTESCTLNNIRSEINLQELNPHTTSDDDYLSMETGLSTNLIDVSLTTDSKNASDLVVSHNTKRNTNNQCHGVIVAESEQTETSQINCIVEGTVPILPSLPPLQNIERIVLKIDNNDPELLISLDNQNTNEGKEKTDVSGCTVENNASSSSEKKICLNSQSDSMITLPSTSASLETYSMSSTLFDQTDLDFGDHELFCDSCDDFHPRHKSLLTRCCKQKKDAANNSLLSCVFEKKDMSTLTNIMSSSKPDMKVRRKEKDAREAEEDRLKNPSVVMPRGKRYLMQFKSKVVNYALNHNAKQAAIKFKVNRGSTLSEWIAERKRRSGSGSPKSSTIKDMLAPDDSEFLSWLEDSKFNLTNELIRQKACEWLRVADGNNRKCQWLRMYAHRLSGTKDSSIKKRYIMYPEAFKRVAVFHAQTHSNMVAARVFGVARRRIVVWQDMSGNVKEKTADDTANNITDDSVDRMVFEWYCSQEPPPSSKQLRCKAVELYRASGHLSIQCGAQWYYRWRARHKLPPPRSQLYSDVRLLTWALTQLDNNHCVTHGALAAYAQTLSQSKVSRGWTFRFCRKHHKLLQAVPEPSTPLPSTMELQVRGFTQALRDTVATHGYTAVNIVAMDEVPLQILPKDHDKKLLLIRRTGFESCQASLVVSCLSDGTLLPSVFIFKEMTPLCKSDPRVISTISDTGLITADIMKQWLTQVCFKQLTGGVLITDCLDVHTTNEIQQALVNHKVHHAVIPGGCAFKLLPIIQVAQMFKKMMEELSHVSIASQTSSLKPPSPDQLYLWSLRVHKHLAKHQQENIKTAFKEILHEPPSANHVVT